MYVLSVVILFLLYLCPCNCFLSVVWKNQSKFYNINSKIFRKLGVFFCSGILIFNLKKIFANVYNICRRNLCFI